MIECGHEGTRVVLRAAALAPRRPRAAGRDRPLPLEPACPAGDRLHRRHRRGPDGLWTATPSYRWVAPPPRTRASYTTAPLRRDTTVIGAGAVRTWIRASTRNVDLQATISEVRPEGKETFVQSGWLRANERRLDRRKSTPLEPVLSLRRRDVRALPRHRFATVTIPLCYEGHAYRRGSRLRVTITAPNGDQPVWPFARTSPKHPATVRVAHSRRRPSSLLLPVVPGVHVPTGLPPCPGLLGEPCRG